MDTPVAAARHAAGLSQRELANRIGVPLWTVDRLERGESDPGPHLAAIADATGLSEKVLVRDWHRPAADVVLDLPADEPAEDQDRPADELTPVSPTRRHVRNVICACVAALVTIRFFAEDVAILPRAIKYVDIPILLGLLLLGWIISRDKRASPSRTHYLLPAVGFLAVCVASAVINSGRAEPAPTLLFIYGFLAPVLIFYVVRSLWPAGHGLVFSRLLIGLTLVQFATVFGLDFPKYLGDSNPDFISGTFGENAYQLVFFLLVTASLAAGIVTFERHRAVARFAPLFFAATAATILLAQYRAILLTGALTVLLIAVLLGVVRVRGALVGVLMAVTFAVALSVVPSIFPELKLQATIDTLTGDPGLYVSKRLEAGGDVMSFYNDSPGSIALGAGPGTFNSRAWETFYDPTEEKNGLVQILPEFAAPQYATDVGDKYTAPRVRDQQTVEGSFALVTPFASYYALLAEVGVAGFLLMVGLYARVLVDSTRMTLYALRGATDRDPLPGLLLASTAGFFVLIQMGILENWWEVTRITFILWILFAIATKEFEARHGALPPLLRKRSR